MSALQAASALAPFPPPTCALLLGAVAQSNALHAAAVLTAMPEEACLRVLGALSGTALAKVVEALQAFAPDAEFSVEAEFAAASAEASGETPRNNLL